MELVDSLKQVYLLYGFDRSGKQTTIAICTTGDDPKEVAATIWAEYPQTDMIYKYPMPVIGEKKEGAYFIGDNGAIHFA